MIAIVGWILVVAALGAVGLAFLTSELLTRPRVKPSEPIPSDIRLPYEAVSFESHDGTRLAGWLVGPELAGPPVVILHGYTDNKSSFLSQARFLHEHAIPSLLLDHRGHGESDSARVSLGPLEARDVVAVLQTLRDEGKGEQFVLWGISMGAATALQAAAQSRTIGGVISESCYERLDQVVTDTLRLRFSIPRFPIVPLALLLASIRLQVGLLEVSMPEVVEALGSRPVLVVSGGRDLRMPPEVGERLLARAANGMKHLVVPGADHAECWALGQPAYGERVLELIEATYQNSKQ